MVQVFGFGGSGLRGMPAVLARGYVRSTSANRPVSALGMVISHHPGDGGMRHSFLWLLAVAVLASCPAFAGDLPNPNLTPGVADPTLATDVLCAPGFSAKTLRNVPTARKKAIYSSMPWRRIKRRAPAKSII